MESTVHPDEPHPLALFDRQLEGQSQVELLPRRLEPHSGWATLSPVRVITTLLLVLALDAFGQAKPLRVAVPGLRGVRLTEAEVEFYSEHLAQSLRAPGLVVVTAREIQTLLGIERQKQLLGCGEGSGSCVAELANALGADAVVLGDVARIDETYQVNVEVIAPLDASVLAQGTRRVKGQVASLDAVASLARELGRAMLEKKGRVVPPELLRADVKSEAGGPRAWAWVPLAGGVAVAGAGVAFLSLAESNAALLRSRGTPLVESDAMRVRDEGKSFQAVGAILLGTGLAAALAGAGLVAFGPREAAVAVVPLHDGAVFSLSGTLP